MILSAILFFVLALVTFMVGRQGLWSAAIVLVNVVTAALLAMNYFEPLATFLSGLVGFVSYWDIISLFLIFAAAAFVFRLVTDQASTFKVKLPKLLDMIGGYVLGLWAGWVIVCFTATALHTAPLAREFMGFKAEQSVFVGSPDRLWLGFTKKSSTGEFASHEFDPRGEFMLKYAARRERSEVVDPKKP